MKIYKSRSLVYFLFLTMLCFTHIPCGYASHNSSIVNERWQSYCAFNGILKEEARWSEEFKMLEEPSDYPNHKIMRDKLSVFMGMSNDFIDNCPNLKKYISELIKYHVNNEKITKETREILDYISQKLTNGTK